MTDAPEISAAGIRRIREARDETQADFGEVLGVTPQTVGKWERADSRPTKKHADAIWEVIPAAVDEADLVADEHTRQWHGRLSRRERRLFGSDKLQVLRDGPCTNEELSGTGGLSFFEGEQRQFVHQLKVGKQIGAAEKPGGKVTPVYYLEGDERRALRRFIEANEEIVAKALAQQANRFQHDWSDFLYGLLEEEWRFWLCR